MRTRATDTADDGHGSDDWESCLQVNSDQLPEEAKLAVEIFAESLKGGATISALIFAGELSFLSVQLRDPTSVPATIFTCLTSLSLFTNLVSCVTAWFLTVDLSFLHIQARLPVLWDMKGEHEPDFLPSFPYILQNLQYYRGLCASLSGRKLSGLYKEEQNSRGSSSASNSTGIGRRAQRGGQTFYRN